MEMLPSLNTRPTLSRSQLMTEQLLGVTRDHETFLSTLHPSGLAYTGGILTSGQRFLDGIASADRERAEADGADGVFAQTFSDIERYIRSLRIEIRAICDGLQGEGQAAQARALRADYMMRQSRISPERPGDLRAIIEQYASSNSKNRALLTSWGVPPARLDRAAALSALIPTVIDQRRRENTEAELAVRERDLAELDLINKLNPLLRRLNGYQDDAPEPFNAFRAVLSKFRDDLLAPEGDDFDDVSADPAPPAAP